MIDFNALATSPFRTASFKLGDNLDYYWEARTDGGATLVRDIDRAYYGEVFLNSDDRWSANNSTGSWEQHFHSREAAFYALAAKVAERNAEYLFNIAQFERGGRGA
jgi:hypothetical protein